MAGGPLMNWILSLLFLATPLSPSEGAKIEWKLDPKPVIAGQPVKGTVVVTFGEGLHGYQNPPTRDYMIPVTISTPAKGWTVSAKYPKGTPMNVAGESEPAAVYEGRIEIPVEIKGPTKAGANSIPIVIRYQLCDATACFPPETFQLKVQAKVKPAPKTKPKPTGSCPCCQL